MSSRPNILLIFSDQHRSCDIGCYGNSEVITPNFDEFSKKAALFKNCISNSPVCVPARGSLLTGRMPNNHRAITNDLPIDTSLESIATVMNKNGYHTGYLGKWHLGGITRDKAIKEGERLNFTEWKANNCNHNYYEGYYYDESNLKTEIEGYEPIEQTNMAINFIDRNSGEPWGLVLSYGTPHDPYFDVPDKYFNIYKDKNLTLRDNVPDRILDRKDRIYNKEQIFHNYKGYYAHITAIDEQFGRILKCLEDTNQLDNTIIVYTSDHGDMLGSQGLTNKQLPYHESINVPLMIYYNSKTVNIESDEIISLVDLPVSLLKLADMDFETQVDGQDLHKLFTEKDAKGADFAYIMDLVPCHQAFDRGSSEWRGIKTKQYTYARSNDEDFCVLFDDLNDKYQMNNLKDIKDIKNSLEHQLFQIVNKYDDFLQWEEFIKKYGYLDEWNKSQKHFKRTILK